MVCGICRGGLNNGVVHFDAPTSHPSFCLSCITDWLPHCHQGQANCPIRCYNRIYTPADFIPSDQLNSLMNRTRRVWDTIKTGVKKGITPICNWLEQKRTFLEKIAECSIGLIGFHHFYNNWHYTKTFLRLFTRERKINPEWTAITESVLKTVAKNPLLLKSVSDEYIRLTSYALLADERGFLNFYCGSFNLLMSFLFFELGKMYNRNPLKLWGLGVALFQLLENVEKDSIRISPAPLILSIGHIGILLALRSERHN